MPFKNFFEFKENNRFKNNNRSVTFSGNTSSDLPTSNKLQIKKTFSDDKSFINSFTKTDQHCVLCTSLDLSLNENTTSLNRSSKYVNNSSHQYSSEEEEYYPSAHHSSRDTLDAGITEVYSMPVRKNNKKSYKSSLSLPSNSEIPESQEEMIRRPRMFRVESQLIQSSAPNHRLSSNIKRQAQFISSPVLKTPTSNSNTVKRSDLENLSESLSPRLNTLKLQNKELMDRQLILEEQLKDQKLLQENVLNKLEQQGLLASQNAETLQMGSLMQETQSVTGDTLKRQETLINALREHNNGLEEEKEELMKLNANLLEEISNIHEPPTSASRYKEEVKVLKSTVQRLSAELGNYQLQYTDTTANQKPNTSLPSDGPIPSWLINTKYLSPLFLAYDEQISTKDDLIGEYEEELQDFRDRLEDVVKENQRLHIRVEQEGGIDGVSITMTEWRKLQEQCKLVLEENQLLMEQLELEQSSKTEGNKASNLQISKLSEKLSSAKSLQTESEQKLTDLTEKYQNIKTKYDALVVEMSQKLAIEEHLVSVEGLKRSISDQKQKYFSELENIKTKIELLNAEIKTKDSEISDLKSANKLLQKEIKNRFANQRKSQKKVLLLKHMLEEADTKEQSVNHYLSSVVKVAEKTAHERDTLVHDRESNNLAATKAINKIAESNFSKAKIENKLKAFKEKASKKLEISIERLQDQAMLFEKQKSEYERELSHLRHLLTEKQELLNVMAGDKKQTETELEEVWQATKADNERIKDTYRQKIRNLINQSHTSSHCNHNSEDQLVLSLANENIEIS